MLRALYALVVAFAVGATCPAAAETKVALVIGNSAYRHVPMLPNTLSDAGDVGAALERLGFIVRRSVDANHDPSLGTSGCHGGWVGRGVGSGRHRPHDPYSQRA